MARTDRDHPSRKRFWDWHEKHCGCGCHNAVARYCYWNCSCLKADPNAPRGGEVWVGPIPSWWYRDQRRAERTKLRQQMREARNGRIDYDDLPSGEGKMYRRPYYW